MGELDVRGLEAYEMLNKGWKKTKVVNYFVDKYSVSRDSAINYIYQGLKHIDFDVAYSSEESKNTIASLYMEIYRANMDAGDHKNAESVMDKMSVMFGAKEPEKIDITTNGESINPISELIKNMTIDELKQFDDNQRLLERVSKRSKE